MSFVDPDGGWAVRPKMVRGSGRKSKVVLFKFRFTHLDTKLLKRAEKISNIPLIGGVASQIKAMEGVRSGNGNIVTSGSAEVAGSFVGGYIGKKVAKPLFKQISSKAAEIFFGEITDAGIGGVLDDASSSVVGGVSQTQEESIYLDNKINSILLDNKIIDKNGDFSEKVINRVKNKIIENGDYDLNNKEDLNKINQRVGTYLTDQITKIQDKLKKEYDKKKD